MFNWVCIEVKIDTEKQKEFLVREGPKDGLWERLYVIENGGREEFRKWSLGKESPLEVGSFFVFETFYLCKCKWLKKC